MTIYQKMNILKIPENWYVKTKDFFVNFYQSFKNNLQRPEFLANSNAVGGFCAFIPTIGQGYLCFLFWLVMRKFKATQFSLAISIAWTVLTNPLTMPFVLFGYYKLGCVLTSRAALSFKEFITQAKDIIDTSTNWRSAISEGIKFAFDDIGTPMLIGCVISVVVFTIIAYVATYYIAVIVRRKKQKHSIF